MSGRSAPTHCPLGPASETAVLGPSYSVQRARDAHRSAHRLGHHVHHVVVRQGAHDHLARVERRIV
eukprot:9353175-Heterocapsa_arctica.AAC.1